MRQFSQCLEMASGLNPEDVSTVAMENFAKNLEEKNVTWARFGKKRDKNTTLGLSVCGDDVRTYCDAVRSEG
ncbi:hypothetical protein Tco_0287001 [Tanacetum coccineum]